MMTDHSAIYWKWGALAALAMMFLSLYPQINLWMTRGSQWQGSFAMTQGDELAYAAYVNALIEGRPRKNDPFNGYDDLPEKPEPESLFSIQFIPAYAIALPARALGLSTATAFIWVIVIVAVTSSFAIFWLLGMLTGNSKLAAVGVLFTLCFGALAGSDRFWHPNAFTDMLPFLRRYQPSVAFPLFFVFCVFVWRALTSERARTRLIYSLTAGLLFSVLVYSYFYLWTAAAAWFGIVVILWLVFQREKFKSIAVTSAVVGAFAVAALIPYGVLVSRREGSMDQSHLLVTTRAPDLSNEPEVIGFFVLIVLAYAVWRKRVDVRSPLILFVASFALLPFVLFNQQVLTGTSLQPVHYKAFIANYVALISVVLVFWIWWRAYRAARPVPSWALGLTAVAAFSWGVLEVSHVAKRELPKALLRDDMRAVAHRLTALAKEDGNVQLARAGRAPSPVVFTSTLGMPLEVSMGIPAESPLAVLWSLHSDSVSMSPDESKKRYYRHLYYTGIDPPELETRMKKQQFWVHAPLFGVERIIGGLTPGWNPVSDDEIAQERRRYELFYQNFGREHAVDPTLNFVVVPDSNPQPQLDNVDKWYERDQGEKIGAFTLYRVRLRA